MRQPLIREFPYVDRYARRISPSAHEADDVIQDTWLVALQREPRDLVNRRAWLKGVVQSRLIDRYRSRERRHLHEHRANCAGLSPSPVSLLIRESLHASLHGSLECLSPQQREVIELRYLDGVPPRQIAAGLGLPVETVRSRSKRALRLLRSVLESRGVKAPVI